jgi:uncharacterized protein (DUF2147 family)
MKTRSFILVVLFLFGFALSGASAANPIVGLWQSIADDGKTVESLAYLYMYQGKVYGRLVTVYDKGVIKETLLRPELKANKLLGSPYFMGLDFIYGMVENGLEWQGLIMDPRTGDTKV